MKDGKHWPYIILTAIILFVIAIVVAVFIVVKNAPVEMSNMYMQGYHDTDENYNQLVAAKNSFDKLYTISFDTKQITEKATITQYTIKNLEGTAVDNAKIEVVFTLPYTASEDIRLDTSTFDGSSYTFEAIDLPHPGRWNIMAKVTVGNEFRFFNLHADTRQANTFEY